jgi:hypothetical protein
MLSPMLTQQFIRGLKEYNLSREDLQGWLCGGNQGRSPISRSAVQKLLSLNPRTPVSADTPSKITVTLQMEQIS